MKELKYTFNEIEACNLCGNKTADNKVMGQRLNKSQGFNPKNKTGISVSVIKCSKCSLIYSNPQPIPFNIQDHYGIPPENYWTDKYFAHDPKYFSYQIEKAKKIISFQSGMTALDIGAGVGKCMVSLEKAGFVAYGIEPSETFREKAISKMNIDPKRLKFGMLEEIDYDSHSFNFITFGAVLEHFYDPAESIERSLKWLKPNGVIQIEVPSSKWLIPKFFIPIFKLRRTNYVTNLSPMHEPYHMFEFDVQSFRELAEKLNFEIVDYRHEVCSIYHVPKIMHPLLRWYMKKTNKGMQLTVWLKKTN